MSVQSTARAALAVLCSSGMLASSRSSQAACSSADGSPSGSLLAESTGDQAGGVFGLPVGQQVRAVLPLGDHAEPPLLFPGQAGQRLVDAGEVGGPPVGLGQAHAGQQRADPQLAGAHPDGEHGLDPRRDAGGADDLLQRRQRDHDCRAAPSSRTAAASLAGSSPAIRSPSRWEQVIPAACMNVASPSWSAQPASQVARSRRRVQPGQAAPAIQRCHQRVRQVPAAGISPAQDQAVPGERAAASSRPW